MDLLSDVVASMRAGTPGATRVELHGTWGWYLPGDAEVAGFLAVLQGSCWLFGNEDEEAVKVGTGDVVLSPHGDGYGLASAPVRPERTMEEARPSEAGFLRRSYGDVGAEPPMVFIGGGYWINRERGHPLLSALPEHIHIRAGGAGLARVLAGLDEEMSADQPGTDALLPLLLDALLLYVLRAGLDPPSDDRVQGWARALADPGIAAALSAVHHDPAQPWTVASLAKVAQMSRATFARRFAALTGQPPMTYVTWWRLNTARALLRDSDLSVQAIATRVGYSSPFAFSHAFRAAHGEPPLRYRAGQL